MTPLFEPPPPQGAAVLRIARLASAKITFSKLEHPLPVILA
ncbi:hypothetical protein Ga0080574_TMP3210 [Salipiger abyssi]|uniref:Uncharacterized protein n=1 Tax=Salipiger abyssi TaxID=1250539 RepID=A0A1P8UVW7_9RHOB|nr:hypothetical protein Ga0080574_TMP3210 [Salipiger abyssi]